MFSAIGHPVLKLKRVGFGPLQLERLPIGQFRYLTPEEVEMIKKLKGKAESKDRVEDEVKVKEKK
jgi:23S rRNA pseudouridine2605 synthase